MRIISLLFLFGLSVGQLFLSFFTRYDGYIYPVWKENKLINKYFVNDAVVVGRDFLVLASGYETTNALTGVYSTFQCLNIAQVLENYSGGVYRSVSEAVMKISNLATINLNLYNIHNILGDVSMGLVYSKILKDELHSGVIGNSGFSVFRYNKNLRILELIERSDETHSRKNKTIQIHYNHTNPSNQYITKVNNGDVVVAYSDGVTEIVPSSFIMAATNFLVERMIQYVKGNKKKENFEYEYDLADFVEDYLQNLVHLTEILIDDIFKNSPKANIPPDQSIQRNNVQQQQNQQMNRDPEYQEGLVQQLPQMPQLKQKGPLSTTQQYLNTIGIKRGDLEKIKSKQYSDDEMPGYDSEDEDEEISAEQKKINARIDAKHEDLYYKEICNILDPSDKSEIINVRPENNTDVIELLRNYYHRKELNSEFIGRNCFKNKQFTEKPKTNHYSYKKLWKCKDILNIFEPIYTIREQNKTFKQLNVYHSYVIEATPKLSDKVNEYLISQYFNSQFYGRNMGIAIESIKKDPRTKIYNYIMKTHYNEAKKTPVFNSKSFNSKEHFTDPKDVDITITGAAITISDRFEYYVPKKDEKFILKRSLENHIFDFYGWVRTKILPLYENSQNKPLYGNTFSKSNMKKVHI